MAFILFILCRLTHRRQQYANMQPLGGVGLGAERYLRTNLQTQLCAHCRLPALLLVVNGKLLIAFCDWELSVHVIALTANRGGHMIINPASRPGSSCTKGAKMHLLWICVYIKNLLNTYIPYKPVWTAWLYRSLSIHWLYSKPIGFFLSDHCCWL